MRFKLVHAKDYGVPQNRPRVLVIGIRKDLNIPVIKDDDALANGFLPNPEYDYPNLIDVFSDLIERAPSGKPNYQWAQQFANLKLNIK